MTMRKAASVVLLACLLLATGCETLVSDMATRIRYQLRDAAADMKRRGRVELEVQISPNHWPDNCLPGAGYRVRLLPYRGGKVVPVGDIIVECHGKRHFGTGLDGVFVADELIVEKDPADPIRFLLRSTPDGIEVVSIR